MKKIAYTALHYGIDYLSYAVESVYNVIDEFHIFYTPHPSHGHRSSIQPIESESELFNSVMDIDHDDKVHWNRTEGIREEGNQRDYCVAVCKEHGADIILVLDYDEIWHEQILRDAIDHVWNENSASDWLINFTHFWKSFDWVCKDNNWPVRLFDTRHDSGVAYVPSELGEIYHFGYCITDRVLNYKLDIHGHKNEIRPNWVDDKWTRWPPAADVHPTNDRGWWMPQQFDPTTLPDTMKSHPFYNLEYVS